MTGKITGFWGTWSSGIAQLFIDGRPITCDNAPTVRALDSCFGDVITEAHTVNPDAIIGREIEYETDDLGLLCWFEPVEN